MPEVGARPRVPATLRWALDAVEGLFTPFLPDDYLELINPMWSTREVRGRVERIERENDDAVTVIIKPSYRWDGHTPGQYLRVGVIVDGVHHWRAYSLTSDPRRPDGRISITPKTVPDGKVSPHLNRELKPGSLVRLGGVEGDFVLPDPVPDKLLFITAGSGITPVMSMLRHLDRADAMPDVFHHHSARSREQVIFCDELERIAASHEGFDLHLQLTGEAGRMSPADLDECCPDWRERQVFASGPAELLDALEGRFEEVGESDRLQLERFQKKLDHVGEGEGGRVVFAESGVETEAEAGVPILVAGEEEGLELAYGCREGICHTCVGPLKSGRVRDLRNGKVHGQEGEEIRICINAPEGPVEVGL